MADAEHIDDAVPNYASFGARTVASFVDVLLAVGAALPAMLVLLFGPTHVTECTIDGTAGTCTQPTPGVLSFAAALLGIGWLGYTVWYCRRAGSTQSVGQRAGALRVADLRTGQPIGGWRIFWRQLAKIVSAIPLGLGFFWMLWDPRRQAWHDKIAATVVVRS